MPATTSSHCSSSNPTSAINPLRVCVLVSSASQSTQSDIAPFDALQRTPAVYFDNDRRYVFSYQPLHKATAVPTIRDLVRSGQYDVFFNLCDGAWDEDRAGREVVEALEAFGVPFTGADAAFYDPSKALMKMMAHYEGVPTPNYVLVEHADDIEVRVERVAVCATLAPCRLQWPTCGFRSLSSHPAATAAWASRRRLVALTHSRCGSKLAGSWRRAWARLLRSLSTVQGCLSNALSCATHMVAGREVTVLVVEDADAAGGVRACTPVECMFPEGQTFKHFDLKWKDWQGLRWEPLRDSTLADQVADGVHAIVSVKAPVNGH